MSLEPILTPEEYESVCQFIAKYEARLAEKRAELDGWEQTLEQERNDKLGRAREIVNNLQSELSALRARAQDYEMHEMAATEEPKPSGRWHAEVFNLSDLIKAAAANPEYEQYLQPVMPLLNKRARKEKRTMYVPGVIATQRVKE